MNKSINNVHNLCEVIKYMDDTEKHLDNLIFKDLYKRVNDVLSCQKMLKRIQCTKKIRVVFGYLYLLQLKNYFRVIEIFGYKNEIILKYQKKIEIRKEFINSFLEDNL